MRAPKRMILVPAPGRKVRAYHDMLRFRGPPPRCHLAEGGESVPVPLMVEYQRALMAGDVTEGKAKKTKKTRG